MAISQPLLLSSGRLACARCASLTVSSQHGSTFPSIVTFVSGCTGNGAMTGHFLLTDPQGQASSPLAQSTAAIRLPLVPMPKLSVSLSRTVTLKTAYSKLGFSPAIKVITRRVGRPCGETYFCRSVWDCNRGCTIQPDFSLQFCFI